MDPSAVTTWLAVLTGAVTVVGTLYGYFTNLTHRRVESSRRLADAAAVAVRRTEAEMVRPLLRDRLQDTVDDHARCATRRPRSRDGDGGGGDPDPYVVRMRLFVTLQRRMSLSESEKNAAHRHAVSNLVAQLRLSPHPPLGVKTERDLERNAVRLAELVECAYNQRPRPGGDMIRSLAEFCFGGGGGLGGDGLLLLPDQQHEKGRFGADCGGGCGDFPPLPPSPTTPVTAVPYGMV